MHAEVTSEKVALGWYLDGKVTAVVGTHTHVPTADLRVLPGGTAYITDVGMTGARGGVIGMKKEQSIAVMRTHMPMRYEPSDEDPWLNGVLIRASRAAPRGLHRANPAPAAVTAAAASEAAVRQADERRDADRRAHLGGGAEQAGGAAGVLGVAASRARSRPPRPSRVRTRRAPPRRSGRAERGRCRVATSARPALIGRRRATRAGHDGHAQGQQVQARAERAEMGLELERGQHARRRSWPRSATPR